MLKQSSQAHAMPTAARSAPASPEKHRTNSAAQVSSNINDWEVQDSEPHFQCQHVASWGPRSPSTRCQFHLYFTCVFPRTQSCFSFHLPFGPTQCPCPGCLSTCLPSAYLSVCLVCCHCSPRPHSCPFPDPGDVLSCLVTWLVLVSCRDSLCPPRLLLSLCGAPSGVVLLVLCGSLCGVWPCSVVYSPELCLSFALVLGPSRSPPACPK